VLVVVASAVAIPLAYYIMSNWLMNFDYRVTLTWPVFVIATLTAAILTLFTISYHATKAALSNPATNLRAE
jgi:hypothetical protein